VAIFFLSEQRRKACRRIEPRKAKPVHAAVATHQRTRLGVTKKSVVLDLCSFLRHITLPPLNLPLPLAPALARLSAVTLAKDFILPLSRSESDARTHRTPKALRAEFGGRRLVFRGAFGVRTRPRVAFSN